MGFVEHGTFSSPNPHAVIKTWEEAIELRMPTKTVQPKSKKTNTIMIASI